MSPIRAPLFLADLVRELCKLPEETEWVEFKRNNSNGEEIGEYISALSNAAALAGKANAYLIWGIDDKTHEIVGTTATPRSDRRGNENLENWLLRLLSPKVEFWFHEKERALWRFFDQTPFEIRHAAENITDEEVMTLLDHGAYFQLLGRPYPPERNQVLEALAADHLIERNDASRWNITNLGALLFAKKLRSFHALERKAVRLIVYKSRDRTETEREIVEESGYAVGFDLLMRSIGLVVPSSEVIEKAIRRTVPTYPPLAVRELVANALIHQDFTIRGAGPMIELFADRLEIMNPGAPLISADRFLDQPPRSRNDALASLMRRMGICEERGSGIDKVIQQTELFQLPAPMFRAHETSTQAILFAPRPLEKMSKDDRIRA